MNVAAYRIKDMKWLSESFASTKDADHKKRSMMDLEVIVALFKPGGYCVDF